MYEGNSTTTAKPSKPYPEFPLTAHPAGYWCKKIRGKLHYFGPWADPDAALAKYLAERDALHADRKPRPDTEAITVKDLDNAFLNAKRSATEDGELSARTWADYKAIATVLVKGLGKGRVVADLRPEDFAALRTKMAKAWGPHRLGTAVQVIRCMFRYAYESELLDKPMRFGPDFKRPSKKTMRLHRAKQDAKMFTAEEIRAMIAAARTPLKAMLLLGINAGYGNADCGRLPITALNLETGWIDFPRPKTGINRRCALWPETVQALRETLASRKEPKSPDHAGLVFITRRGLPWDKGTSANPVSEETRKLMNELRINGHRGFYCLRHTFRTVADEAKDQPAVDHVMGHESTHRSTIYRETISNERLRAVSDYVRTWLFPAANTIE